MCGLACDVVAAAALTDRRQSSLKTAERGRIFVVKQSEPSGFYAILVFFLFY